MCVCSHRYRDGVDAHNAVRSGGDVQRQRGAVSAKHVQADDADVSRRRQRRAVRRPWSASARAHASSLTPDGCAEFCNGGKDCPPDEPAAIGTVCDDSDSCTSTSACQGLGMCTGRRDQCTCTVDKDCDDRSALSVQ